eukprot:9278555-Lingulodinium_polyedra.AAC.1
MPCPGIALLGDAEGLLRRAAVLARVALGVGVDVVVVAQALENVLFLCICAHAVDHFVVDIVDGPHGLAPHSLVVVARLALLARAELRVLH